jgi:hypothetical protein
VDFVAELFACSSPLLHCATYVAPPKFVVSTRTSCTDSRYALCRGASTPRFIYWLIERAIGGSTLISVYTFRTDIALADVWLIDRTKNDAAPAKPDGVHVF